ncbi:ABC transporter permease [Jiangella endophytica]|uniref:ABC transporter permease n=1 Tax=Jiangella endophytica TaxID=1623398 RepID=UPI0018E55403|nr:ABC transporter permease [Jiangella endophytica]
MTQARGRTVRPYLRRIGARALAGVGVLFGAATLGFLALYVLPGDPVYAIAGNPDQVSLSAEQVAAIRETYGFDQPLYQQYLEYLGQLVRGDLGTSYQRQQPVTTLIADQLGPTVQLAAAAFATTLVLAFAVSLLTAKRRFGRGVSSVVELFFISAPGFWVGIVLLTVFSFRLGWLPAIGSGGWQTLVLPALTIAVGAAPPLIQVLRNGLEDTLDEPFVLTARTRGLSEAAVRLRHALRHALIPLTTLTGFLVGGLLGGAVIAETLFSRQGVGRVLVTAVTANDVPLVLGLVLLAALAYVVVNFLVDVVYPLIDPRLRSEVTA